MRIVHAADRWTDRGGAYRYLASLLTRQKAEHEVSLWVGRVDFAVPPPTGVSLVRVPGLESRVRAKVVLPGGSFDELHLHNVVNPEAIERLGRLDAARRRVTVQDHRFFCPGQGKLTAEGRVCTDPMETTLCRGCFTDDAYFRDVFALTAERLRAIAIAAFEVEVLSDYMKRELAAVGLPVERIAVTPPDVRFPEPTPRLAAAPPPPPPSPLSRPSMILFVGRLVAAKGVWDAVAAWRRAGVDLPLVFAGTGPLRQEIERRGFTVLGWLPHDRMAPLLRSAAALLMPSRWQEPFGIAGLEAQALGTPVVAWESGALSEWHAGDGEGSLVPWGDVDALAKRLRAVVRAREHRGSARDGSPGDP